MRISAFPFVLLAVGLIVSSAAASAQAYSVTPTFQASFAQLDDGIQGRSYHAWGLSMGPASSDGWWSPHVWIQRYESSAFCQGTSGGTAECRNDGWMISAGPAIEFVDSGRWTGTLYPEIGIESRGDRSLNGGAGLHVSVDVGLFQPQVFGRLQSLRGSSYATIGAGITFTFGSEEQEEVAPRDPWVRADRSGRR